MLYHHPLPIPLAEVGVLLQLPNQVIDLWLDRLINGKFPNTVSELRARIREAVIVSEQAWFSYDEQIYLTRSLAGQFAQEASDHYYFVAVDEQIVGQVGSPAVKLLYDIYHQQVTEGNLIANITTHAELIG